MAHRGQRGRLHLQNRFSAIGAVAPQQTYLFQSDRNFGTLSGGLDIEMSEDFNISMLAEAAFSEHSETYGGFLRLTYKF
ncbi:hypothetical protein [Ruegeria sp. SCP11]|uniref:hypothetical protein n=1 Tax=Ruegeria sp. SCP11 TaxID=3141378 RepID=UPI003338BDA5